MNTATSVPWLAMLLLGAGHGINPAMGWLFAVARGLQERTARAVWSTLLPLAIGHALAIAVVVALAVGIGRVISPGLLRWTVAATLLGFGVYRLFRRWHPTGGGMQVGARDLAIWSFLMASAHGAGLMVLPFLLSGAEAWGPAGQAAHEAHASAHSPEGHSAHMELLFAGAGGDQLAGLAATLVHTTGYLLVTGLVAAVVYHRLGLRLLRRAWLNLDLVWAVALILTAALTALL
jgi:hypothetical protein